jgi:hypothetical protein
LARVARTRRDGAELDPGVVEWKYRMRNLRSVGCLSAAVVLAAVLFCTQDGVVGPTSVDLTDQDLGAISLLSQAISDMTIDTVWVLGSSPDSYIGYVQYHQDTINDSLFVDGTLTFSNAAWARSQEWLDDRGAVNIDGWISAPQHLWRTWRFAYLHKDSCLVDALTDSTIDVDHAGAFLSHLDSCMFVDSATGDSVRVPPCSVDLVSWNTFTDTVGVVLGICAEPLYPEQCNLYFFGYYQGVVWLDEIDYAR